MPDNKEANADENWENEKAAKDGDDYANDLKEAARTQPFIGPDNSLRIRRGSGEGGS